MAQPTASHDSLTVEGYLKLEEGATVRHPYVGSEIFAMVGATKRHNRIVGNIFGRLWGAARGGDRRVYPEGVKLRVAEDVISPRPETELTLEVIYEGLDYMATGTSKDLVPVA